METDKELELLVNIINKQLFESQCCTLNNAEIAILKGVWKSQTYSQIANDNSYSSDYLSNVVAPELYRRLSELFGQRITKKNCRLTIESYVTKQDSVEIALPPQDPNEIIATVNNNTSDNNTSPPYPNGAVPLNSCFYIKRSNTEEDLYKEICNPGTLIRIKAPNEMGKTSLLLRILEYADNQKYHIVSLNLEQAEQSNLTDLNQFLRWLCANISQQLNLQPKLDEYWDEDLGSKVSCTLYIRNYILEQIESPLVLALDDLQQIFEYPLVAKDFLPLLRSWYEEAKRSSSWQKLRLVVSHSTEIYIPLEINQSPFNVGLPIKLENFDLTQVLQLAQCYKLEWMDEAKTKQLMNKIGGHPALLNIAFYHLSREEINFEQLLNEFSDSTGIYANHLQRHWINLQQQPELLLALSDIINTDQCVKLEPTLAYKLNSLGLIELSANSAEPSCELYKQYFADIDHGVTSLKLESVEP
jgi:AAA-like domain